MSDAKADEKAEARDEGSSGGTIHDWPNQQVVREDGSGPGLDTDPTDPVDPGGIEGGGEPAPGAAKKGK